MLRKVKLIHEEFFPPNFPYYCQISRNGKNSENLTSVRDKLWCSWGVQCSVLQEPPAFECVCQVCVHTAGTLLNLLMCPHAFCALIPPHLTQWTSSPSNNYLWVMGFANSPLEPFVSSSYRRIWWDMIFHCCLVFQWNLQPWQRQWHLHWKWQEKMLLIKEDALNQRSFSCWDCSRLKTCISRAQNWIINTWSPASCCWVRKVG